MPQTPILTPAKFAAPQAMGFSDAGGSLNLVSASSPLPVIFSNGPSLPQTPDPLTGNMTGSATSSAFAPALGTPVTLTLRGTWQGQVKVYRSTDGGTTLDPLTVGGAPWAQFTGNACEAVWEEYEAAARLYVGFALSSGRVSYRLGH